MLAACTSSPVLRLPNGYFAGHAEASERGREAILPSPAERSARDPRRGSGERGPRHLEVAAEIREDSADRDAAGGSRILFEKRVAGQGPARPAGRYSTKNQGFGPSSPSGVSPSSQVRSGQRTTREPSVSLPGKVRLSRSEPLRGTRASRANQAPFATLSSLNRLRGRLPVFPGYALATPGSDKHAFTGCWADRHLLI